LQNPASFDLVITDLNMPVLSGLQLAESILEVRPDMHIVLHSGYLTDEMTKSAQKIGIRRLLPKPSTSAEMIHVLHQLI
jgi:YesN/AraC family two-component response regulator